MKSKFLAIYLPQFHTIPENDEWWGEGFTEWTNVKRGHPFYAGHYQPREPLGDNYYDLADMKVLEEHTRLARKAGIYGFCFYHYYFNGKTLLEKPIENYRDDSSETFPYCLIWANQSWTRTWYRAEKDRRVMLRQNYGRQQDWEKHFYYLLPFFKDKRYIKIDNKPVYIIYIPQDINCRRQMFGLWDRLAKENGFDGLYLIAMDTIYGRDKCEGLYSAYMDFEPLYTIGEDETWRKWLWRKKERVIWRDFGKKSYKNMLMANNMFSYRYLMGQAVKRFEKSDRKTFAGVFPGWDNTARKDEDGLIITGATPKKFGQMAEKMLLLSERQNKEFIFINAWNEWSEGAYLEPDKKYGYAYLNILKKVVQNHNFKQSKKEGRNNR